MSVVYRVYWCARGHSWDVYGALSKRGRFVPDGQPGIFRCPTCDGPALDIDGREPERLA